MNPTEPLTMARSIARWTRDVDAASLGACEIDAITDCPDVARIVRLLARD